MEYGGVRLRGAASLSGRASRFVVDIGFGDSVEPGIETIDYPSLLDLPAPRLRAYAPETVIAEKFQAMVSLGRANSRMKDFYDIWILTKTFDFAPDRLARAIAATFARRQTAIPADRPDAHSGFRRRSSEAAAMGSLRCRHRSCSQAACVGRRRLRVFSHGCCSVGAPPASAITALILRSRRPTFQTMKGKPCMGIPCQGPIGCGGWARRNLLSSDAP